MRITARRAATSTCPLCRAEVARRSGVLCSTCRAISHRECVRELGGCHGTQVEELRREESLRARNFTRARQEDAPPPPTDAGEASTALLCLWGVSVVVAAICSGLAMGGHGAVVTGFMGLFGPFGFYQAWSGIRTGVVETTAKNSSAKYSWENEPLSFLFHVTIWVAWGFLFTTFALLPFFAN